MNIIAADDERLALKAIVEVIKEVLPDANIVSFQKTKELLEYVKDHKVDMAFLDIQMRGTNGIEIAKLIKDIQPDVNIIFATGYSDYAIEAFRLHASGYLMKPVTKEDVQRELDYLKSHQAKEKNSNKDLFVQCFGNFEVFYKGEVVEFNRSKSKELFAYLVHKRGAAVTSPDIAGIIWEDGMFGLSRQKQLQTILSDLRKTFEKLGLNDVIIRTKLGVAVNKARIDCDLYNFIKGDINAINSYLGEYMINYYWAEFTTDYLDSVKMAD